MTIAKQDETAWKVVLTFLHIIAVSSTFIRLYDRFREQRLWWDDYLSILPTVMDVLLFVALWMGPFSGHIYFLDEPNPFQGFLLPTCLHASILWTTRVVLALSLSRLFLPNSLSRRVAFGLAILFAVAYAANILFIILTCKPHGLPWYRASGLSCKLVSPTVFLPSFVVLGITCDLTADVLLSVVPFVMIWRIKLPTPQRRLILAVVSASVLTVGTAVAFSVLFLSSIEIGQDSLLLLLVLPNMMSQVSLIACNLFVVALFFYRHVRHWRAAQADRKQPGLGLSTEPDTKGASAPSAGPSVQRVSDAQGSRAASISRGPTDNYTVITLTEFTDSPYASSYHPSRSSNPTFPYSSMRSGVNGDLDLESRFTDRDPPPSWTFSSGHS